MNRNGCSQIYVWRAADGKVHRLTDQMFNSFNPSWDSTGNYLYFISNREFAPQISNIEFNYATNRDSYIYAMALRKDVRNPFPPERDEVSVARQADTPATEQPKPPEANPESTPKPPTAMS